MRRALLAVVLAAASLGAATFSPIPRSPLVGGHISEGDPRNSVVMPKQRIDLKFNHAVHVGEAGLECTHCHESVTTSTDAKDFNVPAKSACMECHDANEVQGDWGPAAKGKASVLDMPPAHLNFSHQKHLGVDGVTCSSCHPNVAKEQVATVDDLPSMERCISCHVEKGAPTDCRTCHARGRDGTIRTTYDSGTLVPDDHGVFWQKQHGAIAKNDVGECASCHAQEDCLSCHDGAIPPTFHQSNYLALHPQDAMANSPQCASCHRLERFCRDCHFKAEVTFGNPLVNGVTGQFHPPDWMLPDQTDFHGNVARKNLSTCQGCHEQEDCLGCHAFYDGAPEVHPPGWANSARMRRLRDANRAMCMQCHGHGEPNDPFP